MKHSLPTLSFPSVCMLLCGMLTILLPALNLLFSIWQNRHLPPSLLEHTYVPMLEHIVMSATIWLCGSLLLDLSLSQSVKKE